MFGLIDRLTKEFLGKYGRIALDFLLSNTFVICTIVIAYGTLLIFAQRNLEKLAEKTKKSENSNELFKKDPASALAEKDPEFWEQLREASKFPFISLPSSLLFYRLTQANMNKLLSRYLVLQQKTKYRARGK